VGGRVVGSSVLLAFGSAMFLGLMLRPFDRGVGNALILLATIPALVFFWMIVPPLAAIIIWIGVLSSGFNDRFVAPAA
jgi:DMSO reductase anchor subunit